MRKIDEVINDQKAIQSENETLITNKKLFDYLAEEQLTNTIKDKQLQDEIAEDVRGTCYAGYLASARADIETTNEKISQQIEDERLLIKKQLRNNEEKLSKLQTEYHQIINNDDKKGSINK